MLPKQRSRTTSHHFERTIQFLQCSRVQTGGWSFVIAVLEAFPSLKPPALQGRWARASVISKIHTLFWGPSVTRVSSNWCVVSKKAIADCRSPVPSFASFSRKINFSIKPRHKVPRPKLPHSHIIQSDPANSNLVISNSPLFRTQTHLPWTCSSVIYYWLFRTLIFRTIFHFPWWFEIAGFNCRTSIFPPSRRVKK